MYRVLLIESDVDFQKLFTLNLNAYIGAETYAVNNIDDAISMLRNDEEGINLIICRSMINDENVTKGMSEYLDSELEMIPILSMGDIQVEEFGVTAIDGNDWKDVIRESAKILEVTSKKMMEHNQDLDSFFPIPIYNLAEVDTEVCDVDVYIYESDNFDLIIEQGEPFPIVLLEELKGSGIQHLYVQKNDRLKFVNQMTANILMALKSEGLSDKKQISLGSVAFDTVHDMLELTGMTQSAVELAQESVNNMVRLVDHNDPLFELLSKLKENSNSYLYQHSVMISAIAHKVVRSMDWGSAEQADKICFVALFHDICLESDTQARIHSNRDLRKSDLSEREKKLVEQHALKASMLVKSNPNAPFGADSIILQHHGMLNGIGFTSEQNSSLSQLAIVFLVAEDFCDRIINVEPEFFNRDNIVNSLKRKYNKGMFRKVVEVIENINL